MNPLPEEAGGITPWLERVAGLVPAIQEARDTVETLGHLPPDLVARLRDAELYRLWVPRSLGGHEVPPAVMLHVVEEIARHDGSVAWSMMAGANSALLAARLPEAGGREIFGDPLTVVAGSLHTAGTAVRVDGGYRLTGRWRLASGCAEASWLICSASVADEPDSGGAHIFFVRAAESEVIHEWNAVGLRGSGSNGFRVTDVFVPEHRHIAPGAELVVDGPLYRSSMAHFINPPLGALALGIAEDAIGCFHELAQKKTARGSDLTLSERGTVQEKVGTARSLVRSARADRGDHARHGDRGQERGGGRRHPLHRSRIQLRGRVQQARPLLPRRQRGQPPRRGVAAGVRAGRPLRVDGAVAAVGGLRDPGTGPSPRRPPGTTPRTVP